MRDCISFDDVLIEPKFSFIRSRSEVDPTSRFMGLELSIPIISANMDTITDINMARAMLANGAQACLHRFDNINTNAFKFQESTMGNLKPMVSIGLGVNEFERAIALVDSGAEIVVIDVAHGAQISVVEQYVRLREKYGNNIGIIVGNFATGNSIRDFNHHSPFVIEAVKVGIGNGAACTTRVKTGIGVPQLSAIRDCCNDGTAVIADGGCKNSGDIVKSLAAGAKAVMLGRMLAGTDESPGELITTNNLYPGQDPFVYLKAKKYRGSASAESYQVQGKTDKNRAAEGEAYLVPYKGSVVDILQDINGGLRSAMSYVNASNLEEFRANVEFVRCSTLSNSENGAHGKTR